MLFDATKIPHLPVIWDMANMGRLLWLLFRFWPDSIDLFSQLGKRGWWWWGGGYWEYWSVSQLSQVHHRTHIHSHGGAISSQSKGPLLEPGEGAGPVMDQRSKRVKWKIFFMPQRFSHFSLWSRIKSKLLFVSDVFIQMLTAPPPLYFLSAFV